MEFKNGTNGNLFAKLLADLELFTRDLDGAVTAITDAAGRAETRGRLSGSDLAALHALQEADYRATIAASEEQGGRAAERAARAGGARQRTAGRHGSRRRRNSSVQSPGIPSGTAARASEQRSAFCAQKADCRASHESIPSIRVSVLQAAELDHYRDLIADALKGAGARQGVVAEKLAQTFLPNELASMS